MLRLWLLRAKGASEKAKTRLHQRAGFMVRFSSIYVDQSYRPGATPSRRLALRPQAGFDCGKIKSAPENYT
jgi:hypothetical protein